MDYKLSVQLRNCTAARAHLYGAQALILDKQVEEEFLPKAGELVSVAAFPDDGFPTTSRMFYELVKRGIADRHWMLMGLRIYIRDQGLPESLLERQQNALPLAQKAREARLRYYRELESVDLLGGYSSPFTTLDPEYVEPLLSYPGHLPSLEIADSSHLSDEEFAALTPQGYHATGDQ
jgi:hypothetical protein